MEIPDEVRQRVDAATDETAQGEDPERSAEVDAEFDRRVRGSE